ncbi:adenine phosphoribosyltransferase [Lophium mytilinum]|uniref:adenine phosphoribosyltransferase n=1 Tax=Lophium mytilinum TaxID=390894 RepID=A0A6A6QWG9_9PEZI|nr:adenine phosphoribosyltransferase [Lophium mytilinum]
MSSPNNLATPSTTSTTQAPADPAATAPSTSSHPPASSPDPTLTSNAQRRLPASAAAGPPELASLKIRLRAAVRQIPDFPSKGILFEDIMPIFADASLHEALIRALDLHVAHTYGPDEKPDVVVGLDARGFLFGPSLAMRIGAGFAPVRKQGKLPGPCITASYEKEYGQDFFQMQSDAIKPGQKVLVVDDLIATGGSAAAAGSLVKQLGGTLVGYVFILELDFLKGRDKLDAPVYTLLSSQ